MKIKHLFPAAALAIAMTACTADEMVSNPESAETPMNFKIVTENLTRAQNSYCNNDKPTEFRLWAFKQSATGYDNYFAIKDGESEVYPNNYYYTDGDQIKYEGSGWVNKTAERLWPKGSFNMYFYAYVDAIHTNGSTTTFKTNYNTSNGTFTNKFEDYTVAEYGSNQKDLMYAVTHCESVPTGGTLSLNFLHALCQVCFKGKNNDASDDILVSSVSVCNLYSKGTFTWPNLTTSTIHNAHETSPTAPISVGNDTWTFGSFDNSIVNNTFVAQFNYQSDGTTLGITLPKATLQNVDETYKYVGEEKNLSVPEVGDHGTTTDNYKMYKAGALNLIPQQRHALGNVAFQTDGNDYYVNTGHSSNHEKGAFFRISYKIGDTAYSKDLPVAVDWKPGYRYIYTLIFSGGEPIGYDVKVADFYDNTDPNQNPDQTIQ